MPYWFNVNTRQVEEGEDLSRLDDRMGPYATRAEAQNALEAAAENTRRWDEEDAREDEG